MLNEKLVIEIAEQVLKQHGGSVYLERGHLPPNTAAVRYEEVLTGLTVENDPGNYVDALRRKLKHEIESRDVVPNTPFTYRDPLISGVSGDRVLISLCLGFPLVVA